MAAERLAEALLVRHGARVVARNLKVGGGELDLVVDLGGERVVVEVRSVTGEARPNSADPTMSFDDAKARQVRRLAGLLDPPAARVDLVAVRFHRRGVDLHWVPAAG